MKLWLKDFEHNISPATWEAAESLSLKGGVKNLREIETHFWVARVETEDAVYETEIIITPNKIKAYACECFTPGRRLMCAHIGATLLKIRQFLEQRLEDRKAKAEAARSNEISRLTVQSVLENATFESLVAFVKDYARRDRDFSLALKTWFASFVTDAKNPYLLVLDSVMPKPSLLKSLRDPDFRRLRKALDGLESQLNKYKTEANYYGIYQISCAILERIVPFSDKMEGNRKETLMHFSRLAFQMLTGIEKEHLSNELQESTWDFIFGIGMSGALDAELRKQAISFLTITKNPKENLLKVRKIYDATPFPAPPFLLHLFIAGLAVADMPAAAPKVLEDYKIQPDLIREVILQLYYLNHWEAVTYTTEHFLNADIFATRQRLELEEILLYIAVKTGDKERQLRLLKQKFVQSGHMDLFRRLKEAAGESWLVVRNTLMEELKTNGSIPLLATALASEDQLEELAQLLENEGTLPLLQRHEDLFLSRQPAFVGDRYLKLLSQYLDEHFGVPAAVYVRQRIGELYNKGQHELAWSVARQIITQYVERTYLLEELAAIFPKAKRKSLTI
ncbi:MAG: hypothetical protein JNJ57_02820 [Saprospiraceae bacterium]|nr:hypothetical protein [Saprospiraceae bacterium]